MAGHPIEVRCRIRGDSELLSMALVQFLDNAVKYRKKGEGRPWESNSEVMISVHNFGPPLLMLDRERSVRGSSEVKDPRVWRLEKVLGFPR
jgi:hypothetical protein